MEIRGIVFVGTRTYERPAMAQFVEQVLGLAPVADDGIDAEVFALPDGSSFAVTSPDGPADTERTVGFLVSDVVAAAEELKAAGIECDDEISSGDRQRYIHFRGPDGRLYELVENLS